jgi:hypothetical protein
MKKSTIVLLTLVTIMFAVMLFLPEIFGSYQFSEPTVRFFRVFGLLGFIVELLIWRHVIGEAKILRRLI